MIAQSARRNAGAPRDPGGTGGCVSRAAYEFPDLRAGDPRSLGDFQLAARLGEGGMGQVFLAFSPGGQPAAVKMIRSEFARDAEFGRRFAREVAAAQRVRGAHLAQLLDADPGSEQPWLATGYVAGPSLRDLVVGHGPLRADQVMLLAWGIAHALADIHSARVVHRDLKPGNIMLDESGPKVIDFGIVKSLTQSATYRSESTRIGTPLYMSPEQALGRPVGPLSDMFALGSTLHFLATGREAFAAENEWAVAHRIVADSPDLTGLTPPLRDLITACLDKDPERRPTPEQVRVSCESQLGHALGPGAWMRIVGAREAIRARTDALRSLTAPRADTIARSDNTRPLTVTGPAGRGRPKVESQKSATPHKTRTTWKPPKKEPKPNAASPMGEVIARVLIMLLMGLGSLAFSCTSAFMSETWTLRSSGAQVASVTEAFDLSHPWQPISTGLQGVSTDAGSFIAALTIGTAASIAFALQALLRESKGATLRRWGSVAGVLCGLWFFFFTIACAVLLGAAGVDQIDDNPDYMLGVDLMGGAGWLLVANATTAYALWGRVDDLLR
ncbi:serine/threonine-protein kinase [Streptomyces sp. NPDC001941]|uniref:serine/threonine-protein kinase n=1 Tax=Streptomyces sp. NPDC001941 TaxID=3154659 RepID=UPI003328B768